MIWKTPPWNVRRMACHLGFQLMVWYVDVQSLILRSPGELWLKERVAAFDAGNRRKRKEARYPALRGVYIMEAFQFTSSIFFWGLGDAASAQSFGFFGDCQLQVSKFQVWNAKVLEEFLEYVKQSSLSGMEDWRCRFKSDNNLSVADPEMNWSITVQWILMEEDPSKTQMDDDG